MGDDHVQELANLRNPTSKVNSDDSFREIHDLYMDEYIAKRRKELANRTKVYFVTNNTDLRHYCIEKLHPEVNYMISTRKVVVHLWMHNTKPSDISSCLLTENMAYCINSHGSRTREKVRKVMGFLKDAQQEFSTEFYAELLRKLYRRASNTIVAVDANPEDADAYAKAICSAMKADDDFYQATNSKTVLEKEKYAQQIANLREETEEKSEENNELKANINNLTQQLANMAKVQHALEQSQAESKAERDRYSEKLKMMERLIDLKEKKHQLQTQISRLNNEFNNLSKEYARVTQYRWPKLLLIIGIVLLLFDIVSVILDKCCELYTIDNTIYAIITPVAIAFIPTYFTLISKERTAQAIQKYEKKWKKFDTYKSKKEELNQLRKELEDCEKVISNIINDINGDILDIQADV